MAEKVQCPKCGRAADKDTVICPGCDFILDASFLGDDIRDDERAARPAAVAPPPGKGSAPAGARSFDFGDALILGDGSGQTEAFAGDSFIGDSSTGAMHLYVSGASQAILAPDAIPAMKPGVDPAALKLTPFERHLVQFIDGKAAAHHLRKKSGMDERDVKTTLATLADKGVIFMAGRAFADPPQTGAGPSRAEATVMVAMPHLLETTGEPASPAKPRLSRTGKKKKDAPPADITSPDAVPVLPAAKPPTPPPFMRSLGVADAPDVTAEPAVGEATVATDLSEFEAPVRPPPLEPMPDAPDGATEDFEPLATVPVSRKELVASQARALPVDADAGPPVPALSEEDFNDATLAMPSLSRVLAKRAQERVTSPGARALPWDDARTDAPADAAPAPGASALEGKIDRKKIDEKKIEEKKADEKKAEEKKADEKKAEEKKAEEKKAEEKKAEEKKAEEKKAEEKKAEEPSRKGRPPAAIPLGEPEVVASAPVESRRPEEKKTEEPSRKGRPPPPIPLGEPEAVPAAVELAAPPPIEVRKPRASMAVPIGEPKDVSPPVPARSKGSPAIPLGDPEPVPQPIPIQHAEPSAVDLPLDALMPLPEEKAPVPPTPVAPPPPARASVEKPRGDAAEPPAIMVFRASTMKLPEEPPPAPPPEPVRDARPAAAARGAPAPAAAGDDVAHGQKYRAAKIFEQAMKDAAGGNLQSARMNAKLAAIYDPSVPRYAEVLREWDALEENQRAEAAKKAKKVEKPREVVLFEQAENAEARGKFEDAARYLEEAARLRPDNAQLWNRLGVVLATRLKRFGPALQAIQRALELDPANPAFMNNLGKILAWQEEDKSQRKGLFGFLRR